MKRFMSGLLAALLALMMLFSGALAAAEGLTGIGMQVNEQKDDAGNTTGGDINLIVYSEEGAFSKNEVTYQNKDKEDVAVQANMRNWDSSGCATTHVYVVDVAAYVNSDKKESNRYGHRLQDMQETLKALISELPAGDNAVVVPTSKKISDRYLTGDQMVLLDAVDAMTFDERAAKKLAATLKNVADYLENAEGVNARKVVYVLSTGFSENLDKSRVAERFSQQGTTVCAIAFVPPEGKSSNIRNAAKNGEFESFKALAEYGAGGLYCEAPYDDGNDDVVTPEEINAIVNAIAQNDNNFQVLNFQAEEGMEEASEFVVRQGSNIARISVSSANSKAIARILNIDAPNPFFDFIKENWILCLIGVVLVILIVVLLIIVLKRSSSKNDDIDPLTDPEPGPNGTEPEPFDDPNNHTLPVADDTLNVRIDRITQGNIQVSMKPLTTSGSILVGREASSCQILFSGQDTVHISRRHAKLQYQPNGMMTIENMSGNGTKVNNEKINRPTILQQNDLVTFGDVTVRITWWVNK